MFYIAAAYTISPLRWEFLVNRGTINVGFIYRVIKIQNNSLNDPNECKSFDMNAAVDGFSAYAEILTCGHF